MKHPNDTIFFPIFFIRGFFAPHKQFWVYDKARDIIQLKFPKNSFFEWNRNNINLNGVSSDILEFTAYKFMDDKLAAGFKRIQQGTIEEAETQDSWNHICLMMGINFHRVPAMESEAELVLFRLVSNQLPGKKPHNRTNTQHRFG